MRQRAVWERLGGLEPLYYMEESLYYMDKSLYYMEESLKAAGALVGSPGWELRLGAQVGSPGWELRLGALVGSPSWERGWGRLGGAVGSVVGSCCTTRRRR